MPKVGFEPTQGLPPAVFETAAYTVPPLRRTISIEQSQELVKCRMFWYTNLTKNNESHEGIQVGIRLIRLLFVACAHNGGPSLTEDGPRSII